MLARQPNPTSLTTSITRPELELFDEEKFVFSLSFVIFIFAWKLLDPNSYETGKSHEYERRGKSDKKELPRRKVLVRLTGTALKLKEAGSNPNSFLEVTILHEGIKNLIRDV